MSNGETIKNPKVVPLSSKQNKFQQIRNHLEYKYNFRRNAISLDIEVQRKTEGEDQDWEILNESDLHYELYESNYVGFDGILKAILCSSRVVKYNPLESYLNNLPHWKQKDDHIKRLSNFLTVEGEQERFNKHFKKMLVRSIANSLGIIPFNKQCLTLIGSQNDGKTSFLRFLCPEPLKNYYRENIDLYNKDGKVSLANNIFINLDEIATITYKDRNKIKSYMTTESIKERLPYDKAATKIATIANFMASTNEDDFLTDETGNTRWLIFRIKSILHDSGGPKGYNQNVNIDDVYSQAFHLLKNGYKYNLTSEEVKEMEEFNKGYMKGFLELDFIQERYIQTPDEETPGHFHTTSDIAKVFFNTYNYKPNINLIGKALKQLGIKKKPRYDKVTKQTRRGYYLEQIEKEIQSNNQGWQH